MKIISIITIFLMANCLFLPAIQVYAEPRIGNIEIDYEGRTDDREDVILSGAKFVIYPIQYKENEELVWRDEFAGCGISLDDTSAGAREKQAEQLYQYAKDHNISGIIHVTDQNGHTHFLDLAEGIYLIAQNGDVDNGADEFESAPFLVNIPSEVSGKFEYDVDIEPKAEWVSHDRHPVGPKEPDNPGESDNNPETTPDTTPVKTPTQSTSETVIKKILNTVKTGDETNLLMWISVAGISLGCVLVLCKKKKR